MLKILELYIDFQAISEKRKNRGYHPIAFNIALGFCGLLLLWIELSVHKQGINMLINK